MNTDELDQIIKDYLTAIHTDYVSQSPKNGPKIGANSVTQSLQSLQLEVIFTSREEYGK